MLGNRRTPPSRASEDKHMAGMREQAKCRKRRVIFNNDSGDVMCAGANTPEGFLSQRMTPILGTQVDSVFYCTGATTMFSHLANVGETYGEFITDESGEEWINTRDNIRGLRDAGHDLLAIVADFCHTHGLEIVWTHRINDIHDSMESCAPELSRWKREHPEYCMGKPEDWDKYGGYENNTPKVWWSALDFEIQEVRDYLVAILEGVCQQYDIDGIDIDYFRSPMFFRQNLDFQPATPEQIEILTGFQCRIRDLAYRAGNKRGRPILVSVRVPVTTAKCLHVGIDVEQWLKEGLMDLLCISGGYVPFTMPMTRLIELSHSHNVPVYPSVSCSGLRGPYHSLQAWRGVASNAWHAGADGIATFNLWAKKECPEFSLEDVAREIGVPEILANMDKVFAIDNFPILEGDVCQGIENSQILPMRLESWGKLRSENLVIGDDIPAAARDNRLKSVEMRVQLDNLLLEDVLEVRLNEQPVPAVGKADEQGLLTFRPDPAQYRHGNNTVSFRALYRPPGAKDAIVVRAVEVHVKY